MSLPQRQYDQHGFPLPVTFDNFESGLKPAVEKPIKKPPRADERPAYRPPVQASWQRRFLQLALVLFGVGAILWPVLAPAIKRNKAANAAHRARMRFERDDTQGALRLIDEALALQPNNSEFLLQRSSYRKDADDLPGALDDLNVVLEEKNQMEEPLVWSSRAHIWQRMALAAEQPDPNLHDKAIEDSKHALAVCHGSTWLRAGMLNQLAYSRALADRDFDQGLREIDQAIDLIEPNRNPALRAEAADEFDREDAQSMAEFRDTRGLLLCKLGRNDEALRELNVAIKEYEQQQVEMSVIAQNIQRHGVVLSRRIRAMRESLSVMYYHRSLAYEKLDRAAEAEAERQRAIKLGFDPKNGVF